MTRERDETTARHHHFFSASRIIGPFKLPNPVFPADLLTPVHVVDDRALVPVGLHDQQGFDLAQVMPQDLLHYPEAIAIHDLTGRKLDPGHAYFGDRVAG